MNRDARDEDSGFGRALLTAALFGAAVYGGSKIMKMRDANKVANSVANAPAITGPVGPSGGNWTNPSPPSPIPVSPNGGPKNPPLLESQPILTLPDKQAEALKQMETATEFSRENIPLMNDTIEVLDKNGNVLTQYDNSIKKVQAESIPQLEQNPLNGIPEGATPLEEHPLFGDVEKEYEYANPWTRNANSARWHSSPRRRTRRL